MKPGKPLLVMAMVSMAGCIFGVHNEAQGADLAGEPMQNIVVPAIDAPNISPSAPAVRPAGTDTPEVAPSHKSPEKQTGAESNSVSEMATLVSDVSTLVADISGSDWDLATELTKYKSRMMGYAGGGLGTSEARYSSNSKSEGAWKLFGGLRGENFGMDFGFNKLSHITATINSQLVSVSTEAYSLSLLGYLPLGRNADIFLKYGETYWNVNASSESAGYLPVKDGFNRVYGAGLELRSSMVFLRVEQEVFNKIFESDRYTFTGISVGIYGFQM